jgi:hypothetical protein
MAGVAAAKQYHLPLCGNGINTSGASYLLEIDITLLEKLPEGLSFFTRSGKRKTTL